LPFRVDGVIGTASRERSVAAAASLPAGASRFFGFESRLGDGEADVDFLACIAAGGGQREAWARALSDVAGQGEARRRLAGFVADWADPRSPYHDQVSNMWVEYDLAGPDADGSIPNLFLGSSRLGAAEADPAGHAWLADAVARLTGAPLDPPRRAALARCLAALPADGRLFQTGMMLARSVPVLRLCMRGIAREALPAYLVAIGWPGRPDDVEALLTTLAPFIGIDVGDTVGSKVGFECYIAEDDRLLQRLAVFLDHLCATRLCTPTKAAGLLAWYGLTHERWCRERWPADLREQPDRPSQSHSGGFLRTLHHVKLNLNPPAPMEAKAYLGARFAWVDDAALKRLLAAPQAAGAAQPPRLHLPGNRDGG
jgi:hypothetical protein